MPLRRKRFLVTGGSGFIGSAFIRYGLEYPGCCERIVNLDLLTYAADPSSLASVEADPRYRFIQGDINDRTLVEEICRSEGLEGVIHFAAESHVDRSIAGPEPFITTNILGTFSLLEVVRRLPHLHFHHVSTDEVFGSLGQEGKFSEDSPYAPNSPYSASKAASDHLVRAYSHTYGLSTTTTHCTNNYGPFQCSEKMIPRMIEGCIRHEPLQIYGTGLNRRDWLYVEDHVEALWKVVHSGKKNVVYGIGGGSELSNIDLVGLILEEVARQNGEDLTLLQKLVVFGDDRAGHDFRYAIDSAKICSELGWRPRHCFAQGLAKTVEFYLRRGAYARQ